MTCIAGVARNGRVWIGADSAAVAGNYLSRVTRLPKVFRVGAFLIGYTSSFRMGQLLEYSLSVRPQEQESNLAYMVGVFVEAVRKCLKDGGYSTVESNKEKGGQFLVGYKGHLYFIDSDFQCNEAAEQLDACGCAEELALGALAALWNLEPVERIRQSLQIAAHFSGAVRGPFTVLELGA